MEAKLLEYRTRKRREAFVQAAKDKLTSLIAFNFTQEMSTVEIPDDNTHLLPSSGATGERAASPALSSDNESEDMSADGISLYARISKTSFIVMSFVLWFVVLLIFIQIEFGAIYLIVSALVGIFANTRTRPRKRGEISAYSVFNKNCEKIDGTFTAEQLEKQLLYGPAGFR